MAEFRDGFTQADLDSTISGPTSQPSSPSRQEAHKSQGASSDGGSFDCNICLEMPQDPVVTLCGHLFCWPCLYRWLHLHSTCLECPVCKALVSQETVVPLYGRGKSTSSDPRTKSVPGFSIPQRPAGQRPQIAYPPAQHGFNSMAETVNPLSTARFGSFSFSGGLGLFPSLFGLQMRGFHDAIDLGLGHSFAFPMGWHNAHLHAYPHAAHLMPDGQQEALLSKVLLVLGILVALWILMF